MYSQGPLPSLAFESLLFWDVPQYSACAGEYEKAAERACSYLSAGFSPVDIKSPCVAGFKALVSSLRESFLKAGNCEA